MFSQQPFVSGEKLVYSAGFRFFSAGTATLEILADTLNGIPSYRVISRTRTDGLLDRFYQVRDEINVWLDYNEFNLLKMEKKIHEGRYRKNFTAVVDPLTQVVDTGKKQFKLPGNVVDPTSAIYYMRTKPLNIGDKYSFYSFDNGKVKEILVTVTRTGTVSVPAGIFRCVLVSPSSADGSQLLKNEGQMKIWFSTDDRKLPVKIEQKTSLGTMILELKSVEIPLPEEPGDVIEENEGK